MVETLEQPLTAYDAWLNRPPLTAKTRTAYRLQVRKSGAHLAQRLPMGDDPLHTPFARDSAIRDDKSYIKTERR